jgi:NADP-dependent 3-hydroxy acid dehydrogenase YdfG
MDVRSPDDNRRLVKTAVERFGRLDTIVPNAGIGLYGSILDHGDDHITEMMDTNCRDGLGRAGGRAGATRRGRRGHRDRVVGGRAARG